MEEIKIEDSNEFLLSGRVFYNNGLPASKALIIVEKIIDEKSRKLLDFTLSNDDGDYIFLIEDRNISYKISAYKGL
ncbi:hypothetical protein [Clostridium intestinale]|jgi:hypothetical protein|uniref:Uncharacterized protein n=2 Tax=Clostridium intestinale TaxID=36845 RepID=U2NHR0_9CLOT|nr:hypothetical protein [Clostridium intestinale]ERK28406.1 hypothetical protein CINTURNW_4441 [Clostridium intestinale URNW]QLY79753.1 hypothetical protein HZF06_22490 [Clostridium intestinale]